MTAEQPKDATLLQLLLLQNGPPLLERVIAAVGGKGVPTLRCVCKTMREEVDRLVEKVHLTADAVEEVCLDGGLIDRLPALRKVVLCNEASHSAAPAAALLMRLCEQSSCSRYLRSFRLIGQGRDARTPCGAPLTLLTRWADTLRHLTLDRPALCSPSLLMLKKLTSLESLVLRSGVLGIECRAPLAQLDALSNLTR